MVVQQEVENAPLTAMQKGRLLFECIPLVGFAVLSVIAIVAMQVLSIQPSVLLWVIIVVVLLFLGYQSLKCLRDLLSGVAVVERDVLNRSLASRNSRHFWGNFERLGRMRLLPRVYFNSSVGVEYRVVYSPISKIVWELGKVS
jgi:hypothetical protein